MQVKPGPKIGPHGRRQSLTVTIAEDLRGPLRALAAKHGLTVSRAVEKMIRRWVEADKKNRGA